MRRVLRIIINGLTLLSLALAVIVATLYLRSYFKADAVYYDTIGHRVQIQRRLWSAHGFLGAYGNRTYQDEYPPGGAGDLSVLIGDSHLSEWSRGLRHWHLERFDEPDPDGMPRTAYIAYVMVPHWALCGALLVMPVFWLRRERRNARNANAIPCEICGYDLRATPARCPECGTVRAA